MGPPGWTGLLILLLFRNTERFITYTTNLSRKLGYCVLWGRAESLHFRVVLLVESHTYYK